MPSATEPVVDPKVEGVAQEDESKRELESTMEGLNKVLEEMKEALEEKENKIKQLEEVGRFLETMNLDLMARVKNQSESESPTASRPQSASPTAKAREPPASEPPAGHPSSDVMKLEQMTRELMGEEPAVQSSEEGKQVDVAQAREPAPSTDEQSNAVWGSVTEVLEEFSEGVPAPLDAQLRSALHQLLTAAAAYASATADDGRGGAESLNRAVQCLEGMLECYFVMTLAGVVIANPRFKRPDMDARVLSGQARDSGVPFFELHSWIRAHLRDLPQARAEDSDNEADTNKPAEISAEELAEIVDTPLNTPAKPQPATPASGKKTWFGFMRSSKPSPTPAPASPATAATDIEVPAALQGNEDIETLVRKFRHQKELSKKLLQQNLYLTDKLKKSVQRRRALEMALEQEQLDKDEESQRAAAVKQVCDLLSQQLAEREDSIRELAAGEAPTLSPEASDQPAPQFDVASL